MILLKKLSLKSNRGCLFGCSGLIVIVIILPVTGILLLNVLFPNATTKEKIRNSVFKNKALFEDSIDSIKKFDKYVDGIEHTKYYPPDKNPNIKGVFICGFLNGKYVKTPLENKEIEKLFLNAGVKHIFIYDNCIDFSFGGEGRNYYCGVVWTSDGSSTGFQGENMKLVPNRTGWEYKEEKGDNYYYTEKIIDNWYFYEMWF